MGFASCIASQLTFIQALVKSFWFGKSRAGGFARLTLLPELIPHVGRGKTPKETCNHF